MSTSKPVSIRATGIPWYRREDYARILTVMEDAQLLPETWEDWFKKAKNVRDQLRRKGHVVEQVYIDPDTFPGWCLARGLDVNAKARTAFANEAAYRKFARVQ